MHPNRVKLHAFTWSLGFLRQYTSQTKYNSTFVFSDNLGKHFKVRILQVILFMLSGMTVFFFFFKSITSILNVKNTVNIGSTMLQVTKHFMFSHIIAGKIQTLAL